MQAPGSSPAGTGRGGPSSQRERDTLTVLFPWRRALPAHARAHRELCPRLVPGRHRSCLTVPELAAN